MIGDTPATLPPVTFVLGGARSGKSTFGQGLAVRAGPTPTLIATARVADDEMAARIQRHQSERGAEWATIEEDLDLAGALGRAAATGGAILVDCLTLWLANLIEDGRDPEAEIQGLCDCLGGLQAPVIFVSNEVGAGIVPANALARGFRDHSGRMNQTVAAAADQVFLVTAGLPQKLK